MSLEKVHPDCYNFVLTVEALLEKRQQDADNETRFIDPHNNDWGPRTWTRTEMEDMVYSSYKQMRRGRITRPPRRDKVMEIADYLNCTLEERNRLLVAAETAPLDVYIIGEDLENLLKPNISVAQSLEIPAMVINRDWRIHFLNAQMLALYGVSPAQLNEIPEKRRNLLHLLFDPELPLYTNLIGKRESWTRMARQTIYAFKIANQLCQFEDWYQALVQEWMQLPQFAHHWQTVHTDIPFSHDYSVQHMPQAVLLNTAIPSLGVYTTLRPLIISAGYFQFDFPQIMALAPVDDESRLKLVEAGVWSNSNV